MARVHIHPIQVESGDCDPTQIDVFEEAKWRVDTRHLTK
jgi:hypothetical protein